MPRITKATRTSLPVNSNKYDLNKDFRDHVNGNSYNGKDSLVLWSDFCDPGEAAVGLFDVIGTNQNSRYGDNRHKLYSISGLGLSNSRNTFNDFCGQKCYFYLSAVRYTAPSGYNYASSKDFKINDHDDLSFSSSGFAISFWVYPKAVGGFNINDGGTDAAGNPIPTFFEKQGEYSFKIDHNGRLRLTLLTDSTNFMHISTTADAFVSDQWNQITVTYDGTSNPEGITIYNNGVNITDISTKNTTGTFTSMPNTSNNFLFGVGSGGASNMPSAHISGIGPTVFISELCIWDSSLDAEAVRAIYHATLTCASKGEIIESGYVNEPPRLRLRRLDSATGSYPTVMRTGDQDFMGNFKIKFDDLNTLVFGEKIVDEFTNINPREVFSRRIDANKWFFTSGMEIRRESLPGYNGATFEDGVLVFKGPGERSIRTKNKVRNANISFELVQGPHNLATNIIGEGLKLEAGILNENLKLQFSIDGTNWTTIKTFPPSLLTEFYSIFDKDSVTVNQQTGETLNRRRKLVNVNFTDINAGGNSYYVRLYQQNTARTDKSVWGVGRIEITSMNQDIRYPLLVNHETDAGRRIFDKAVMTPHTRSDLSAIGRSLPHAADHFVHFTSGENLSPFKEHYAVEDLDPTNTFHAIGSDPATGFSGFSSRLADKTKITINLESNNTTTIGQTDVASVSTHYSVNPAGIDTKVAIINVLTGERLGETYNYAHNIMCLYDNKSKTWIRKSLPPVIAASDSDEEYISNWAHLGFGPIDLVATRSDGTLIQNTEIVEQYGKNILSNYVRPVKTFGFPFSNKYELDSDKTINMSEYINKPFVLEKVIVEFSGSFEFAPVGAVAHSAYGLPQSRNSGNGALLGPSTPSVGSNTHSVHIPTFFILNQFKDRFKTSVSAQKEDDFRGIQKFDIQYGTDITSGSLPHRDVSRELVTYGQMTLYASSSDALGLDIEKALDDGLRRDLNINILEKTGQLGIDLDTTSINSITGSYTLEFPCRTSPKTYPSQRITIASSSDPLSFYNPGVGFNNIPTAYYMSDNSGGRSYTEMQRGNRGMLNNFPGITPGRAYRTFSSFTGSNPVEVNSVSAEAIDQYSPYILFPGDELIFGWQYPANVLYSVMSNMSGDAGKAKNLMNIHEGMTIHLYGSLVSNGVEYHEYNNTPLTSNAIHEAVGAEKNIDFYQIATKGEISGSYIDQWVYQKEIFDHAILNDIQIFSNVSEKRLDRIGSPVFSISANETQLRDKIEHLYAGLSEIDRVFRTETSLKIMAALSERKQTQRYVRLKADNKFYSDSVLSLGAIYNSSTYGTSQNYFTVDSRGFDSELRSNYKDGALIRYPGRPKYYFDYKHFGHMSDLISQAKDGKIWQYVGPTSSPAPGTLDTGEAADLTDTANDNNPPVIVQFVSSSNVNDRRTRIYRQSSFTALTMAGSERHKMYNSSLYSTASVPFRDHERTEIFTENIR